MVHTSPGAGERGSGGVCAEGEQAAIARAEASARDFPAIPEDRLSRS